MAMTLTALALAAPPTEADEPARYRIDRAAVDARCAELGAHSDGARAHIMGINRTTLHRWTAGTNVPRKTIVDRVCERLGLTPSIVFPGMPSQSVETLTEAAQKVAANWPTLSDAQRDELSRIFAPIVQAEKLAVPQQKRRAA